MKISPSKHFPGEVAVFRVKRSGVTILEVLFAVMVATIGLLGALAVFPVASSQARRGQIADQVASAGDMAVHAFDTMGMRRPDKWVWWNGSASVNYFANPPSDGVSINSSAFGREAVLIDPMFVDDNFSTPANANAASIFPSPVMVGGATYMPSFKMRRVTLTNGLGSTARMGRLQAESNFRIDDLLSWLRPGNQAAPAQQLFVELNGKPQGQLATPSDPNVVPMKRQGEGRLTWMAMLTPKFNRLTHLSATDEFSLSVIIMENRPNTLSLGDVSSPEFLTEWFLNPVYSAGPSQFWSVGNLSGVLVAEQGGEVTVSAVSSDFLKPIKRNSWVMLSTKQRIALDAPGNGYYGNDYDPCSQHRWYRVVDVSEIDETVSPPQMNLSLLGPDWPLGMKSDGTVLETQITVMPSVIGVYEKTIRLEQD